MCAAVDKEFVKRGDCVLELRDADGSSGTGFKGLSSK